jgi:UDP-GlcNAc3NAcA epimerase
MKAVTIVGARPQFIKAAIVSRALARTGAVQEVLIHTGQHHDAAMSEVFFSELGIGQPRHHLGVHGGGHGEMTGRMLEQCERALLAEAPDVVLVYGDTNSTLAGALAAAKLGLPVAHVEAGLRSFDRSMPEELNRVLVDHMARLHFAPSTVAVANLVREGIAGDGVHCVGDVMFDAARHFAGNFAPAAICAGLVDGAYILATVHRAGTTDDPLRLGAVLAALRELAKDCEVVLPLHPRTRARVAGAGISLAGVRVVEPLGYPAMLTLTRGARVVLTDSGGVQKEAYWLGRPCVTLRENTEWVELLQTGRNVLAGTDTREIVSAARRLSCLAPARPEPLYGDGRAADRIAANLTGGLVEPLPCPR